MRARDIVYEVRGVSSFPLRLISLLGFAVFAGSFLFSGRVVWTRFLRPMPYRDGPRRCCRSIFSRNTDLVHRSDRRVSVQGPHGGESAPALLHRTTRGRTGRGARKPVSDKQRATDRCLALSAVVCVPPPIDAGPGTPCIAMRHDWAGLRANARRSPDWALSQRQPTARS